MGAAPAGSSRITDRIERLRALEGECRSATPPVPRSAKIELTSRCNFGCRFCASHLRRRTGEDMPWKRYVRLARELRDAGVEQLGLFYIGESLLFPKLDEAVRYAKEDCGFPYVFLTTNGSLATRERVRGLMQAGLDSLKFALNFADGGQIADGGGIEAATCARVVRNLLDACDERDDCAARTGKRCTVSASSLAYDDDQPERMSRLLDTVAGRLDQHYWLPLFGRSSTWRDCTPGKQAPQDIVVRKPLPCWPLFTEAHITADGHLSACSLDGSAHFQVADLDRCTFAEAWHSPAYQALRAAHLRGDTRGTACAQCIGYADDAPASIANLPEPA